MSWVGTWGRDRLWHFACVIYHHAVSTFVSPPNSYMHRKREVPGSKRFYFLPGTSKADNMSKK